MAATGYTPISLYYSTTAAAVPVNTNLVNGELAINITDGKLYYKDNAGTVQLIADKATASGGVTSISFGSTGLTPSTTTTGAVTVAGTLAVANGGTGVTTSTGSSAVVLSTTPTLTGPRFIVSALGTLTTGTTTIDLATANSYSATITASNTITIAFSNAPSAGNSQVVLLRLTNAGGGTLVWPANTKFAAGTAPTLTASGVDVLGVYYDVTTTTYMIFVIGLDVKVP
jgi:hypothetical protein